MSLSWRGVFLALTLGLASPGLAGPPRADWGLPPVRQQQPRPWLGISVTEVEGETNAGPGLTLARISEGGPAAKAGLKAGDVLLAVDGRVLEGAAGLKSVLSSRAPGDTLRLTLVRGGRVLESSLVLSAAPDDAQAIRRVQAAPDPPSPTSAVARPAPPAPVAAAAAPVVALTYLGDATRPSLGIDTMDLEPGLARFFGAAEGEGVLVETVHPGSPAERAGLKAGDVLLRLGDRSIMNGATLAQALRGRAAGERVALTLLRGGKSVVLAPILAPESVPEWRLATEVAAAPKPGAAAAQKESLSALVEHRAREIARLEVLLAAEEDGDEELIALLGRGASGAHPAEDARALRERLAAMRREMIELQSRLAQAPPAPKR